MIATPIEVPFDLPVRGAGPKFDDSQGMKSFSPDAVSRYFDQMRVHWNENRQLTMFDWISADLTETMAREFKVNAESFLRAEPSAALGMVQGLREDCATIARTAPVLEGMFGFVEAKVERAALRGLTQMASVFDKLLSVIDEALRPTPDDLALAKKAAAEIGLNSNALAKSVE